MPSNLQPAATNRVAQYAYFAMKNIVQYQACHDRQLIKIVPQYSNSVQRLSAMQYVAATATNAYERQYAQDAALSLSQIPTNQLNDISWLEE